MDGLYKKVDACLGDMPTELKIVFHESLKPMMSAFIGMSSLGVPPEYITSMCNALNELAYGIKDEIDKLSLASEKNEWG